MFYCIPFLRPSQSVVRLSHTIISCMAAPFVGTATLTIRNDTISFDNLRYLNPHAIKQQTNEQSAWAYIPDMDNVPGPFLNATTITPDMDAFFLQEGGGFPSQYFFAVSPKHPIMFLAVHDVMKMLHDAEDTGKFYVPFTTGPGSIKRAMLYFMGYNSSWTAEMANQYAYPVKGLYVGKVLGNRTVTIEGSRQTSQAWVARNGVRGRDKNQGFKMMNITNYQEVNKESSGKSCIRQLLDHYTMPAEREKQIQEALHHRRW